MAQIGEVCDKCRKGTVKLNEYNLPKCDHALCLILHLPEQELSGPDTNILHESFVQEPS